MYGGTVDAAQKYIAPTIVDAASSDPIMRDEIFGPILPIVTVSNTDGVIDVINEGEKPLAAYIFSKDSSLTERVLKETSSGGACVNDCLLHFGCERCKRIFVNFRFISGDSMPFGGVGNSGMGAYHAKWGFDTFTHRKAVLKRAQNMEALLE